MQRILAVVQHGLSAVGHTLLQLGMRLHVQPDGLPGHPVASSDRGHVPPAFTQYSAKHARLRKYAHLLFLSVSRCQGTGSPAILHRIAQDVKSRLKTGIGPSDACVRQRAANAFWWAGQRAIKIARSSASIAGKILPTGSLSASGNRESSTPPDVLLAHSH